MLGSNVQNRNDIDGDFPGDAWLIYCGGIEIGLIYLLFARSKKSSVENHSITEQLLYQNRTFLF